MHDVVPVGPAVAGRDVKPGQVVALYAGRKYLGPWFEILEVKRPAEGRDRQVRVPAPGGGVETVWKGVLDDRLYPLRDTPITAGERPELVRNSHFVSAFPLLSPAAPPLPKQPQEEREDEERRAGLPGWPDLTGEDATAVAAAIWRLAENGTLKPGSRFPAEQRIAWATHATGPVIRAAKKLLEDSGVLTALPGKGVYVGRPNPQQLPLAPGPSIRPVIAGSGGDFLPDWPDLRGKSAEQIAAAVRELIRAKVLRQGRRMPDQALVARRTGATANAVKTAWQRLTLHGVLRYERGRGHYVRQDTGQEENR